MDRAAFERLLYEGEGATLDFKKEQYPFAKATDEVKSEILKDIIGFANAWRRAAGYILIGVAEKPGERAEVLGIPPSDHLADHSLQQFVNNQTNRPIRFQYEAFGHDGLQVGIIRIDEQQVRPIYLKNNYGKLKKECVFVRRGSSTDPDKPATLDEVALMGQGSTGQSAELRVEFASTVDGSPFGSTINIDAELCSLPDRIPEYRLAKATRSFGLADLGYEPVFEKTNRGFFRDVAYHHFCRLIYKSIKFAIHNTGAVAATKVRIELTVEDGSRIKFLTPDELPREPRRKAPSFDLDLPRIRPAFPPLGTVEIEKFGETVRLSTEFGDIQPGRRMLSEPVLCGSGMAGPLTISGRIFAGNLPDPFEFALTINNQLTYSSLSLSELGDLAGTYGIGS